MFHFPDTNNTNKGRKRKHRGCLRFLSNKGLQIALEMSVAFQPYRETQGRAHLTPTPVSKPDIRERSRVSGPQTEQHMGFSRGWKARRTQGHREK